jgi:PKD repeat protein
MKNLFALLVGLLVFLPTYARHVRGGEMSYRYIGPGAAPNSSRYFVRLKLYIDCFTATSAGQNETSEPFTIFKKLDNSFFEVIGPIQRTSEQIISYDPGSNPCISNPPKDICYKLKFFDTTIDLPDDPNGYIISFQRCCRIAGIENLGGSSDNYGATYSCEIPGTNTLPLPDHNSSPVISGNDAVAICTGTSFTYDFSATDPDLDSLVYSLCDAYTGATLGDPAPTVSSPPPFTALPYKSPYSGSSPLGLQASIDPATGIISGIAPNVAAQYVVSGCIYEYRKGKLINIHRKDIHLRIADCNPLKAALKPNYDYCDDFNVTFSNLQLNPGGTISIWQFGDGSAPDTTADPTGLVRHQYADTGTYKVKLKVILAGQCTDSATTMAAVYPGFKPGFIVAGSCVLSALQFIDTSTTKYGFVNAWSWNFGDESSNADTSHLQNPSWKYSKIGIKKVTVTIQTNKGCTTTLNQNITVLDKPIIKKGFSDTLICSRRPIQDSLLLVASGFGEFSWTPTGDMINSNTNTPIVFPTQTTTYIVELNENGCINFDSVRVRVVDHVTLDAGPDTTICLTDKVTLHPVTDGLAFSWSPAISLNNPNIEYPGATPTGTTTYQITSKIGKCFTNDNVTIKTVPYPSAFAGADTIKCFVDTIQLNGKIKGASFAWSPAYGLSSTSVLNPLAFPFKTTSYVLTVYDVLGCPKPGKDTVVVTVRPPIIAFAGNDTLAVVNQPLKLTATGAQFYLWTPPSHLDNNTLQSPTAIFNNSGTYAYSVKVYTAENCFSTDSIHIKVFNSAPDIFVPNAFTPGQGQNNLFRPIAVGISRIDYFRVYNRWGNLIFSSNDGRGWNGMVGGKMQAADTYVWVVQGRDFIGKIIHKKGSVVLIR